MRGKSRSSQSPGWTDWKNSESSTGKSTNGELVNAGAREFICRTLKTYGRHGNLDRITRLLPKGDGHLPAPPPRRSQVWDFNEGRRLLSMEGRQRVRASHLWQQNPGKPTASGPGSCLPTKPSAKVETVSAFRQLGEPATGVWGSNGRSVVGTGFPSKN